MSASKYRTDGILLFLVHFTLKLGRDDDIIDLVKKVLDWRAETHKRY